MANVKAAGTVPKDNEHRLDRLVLYQAMTRMFTTDTLPTVRTGEAELAPMNILHMHGSRLAAEVAMKLELACTGGPPLDKSRTLTEVRPTGELPCNVPNPRIDIRAACQQNTSQVNGILPRTMPSSRSRILAPSSRTPECMYSFVTHCLIP